jgi:hypothetical protein
MGRYKYIDVENNIHKCFVLLTTYCQHQHLLILINFVSHFQHLNNWNFLFLFLYVPTFIFILSTLLPPHNTVFSFFFSSLSPSLYHQFTPFLSPTPPSWQLRQTSHHHDVTTLHIYKSCSISSLSNPRTLTSCLVPFMHCFVFPSGIHLYLRFDHLFPLILPF